MQTWFRARNLSCLEIISCWKWVTQALIFSIMGNGLLYLGCKHLCLSYTVMVQVSVPHSGIVRLWYFIQASTCLYQICLNLSLTLNWAWFHQSIVTIIGVFVLIQCLFFIIAKKFSHLKKKKKKKKNSTFLIGLWKWIRMYRVLRLVTVNFYSQHNCLVVVTVIISFILGTR